MTIYPKVYDKTTARSVSPIIMVQRRRKSYPRVYDSTKRMSQSSDQNLEIAAARVAMSKITLEHFFSHEDIGNRRSIYSEFSINSSAYLSSHNRKSSRTTEYDFSHEPTILEANRLLDAAKSQASIDISQHLLSDLNKENIKKGPEELLEELMVPPLNGTPDDLECSLVELTPNTVLENKTVHQEVKKLQHEVVHLPRTLRGSESISYKFDRDSLQTSPVLTRERKVSKSKNKRREKFICDKESFDGDNIPYTESTNFLQSPHGNVDLDKEQAKKRLENELNKIEIQRQELIADNEKIIGAHLHTIETQNKFVDSWKYPGEKDIDVLLNLPETQECLSLTKRGNLSALQQDHAQELTLLQDELQRKTLKLSSLLETNQERLQEFLYEANEIQNLRDSLRKENLKNKNQLKDLRNKYQSKRGSLQLSEFSATDNSLRYQYDECALLKADIANTKEIVAELEDKVGQCDLELQETQTHINKLEMQVQEEKDLLEKIREEFGLTNAAFVTRPISNYSIYDDNYLEDVSVSDDRRPEMNVRDLPACNSANNDQESNISFNLLDRFFIGKSAAERFHKYKINLTKENIRRRFAFKNGKKKPNVSISGPIIPRTMDNTAGAAPMRLISLSEAKELHGQYPHLNHASPDERLSGNYYRRHSLKRGSFFQEVF